MDKLLKLAEEHQEVFESLALFKKAMQVTSEQGALLDIPKLQNFFQEYVLAHFQYEENQIFPRVLKSAPFEAKTLVRQLQKEHIEIYAALDQFQELALCACGSADKAARKKIESLVSLIIKKIVQH